jgi:F-type H+-transporting ATPase subunit epsilon
MALPDKLTLEIVTPDRRILSELVDSAVLPGSEGYLGVLPGHTPLLTSLKIGEIEYRKGGETHYVAIAWGFAEVLPDKVTVLADIAEGEAEIDVDRAEAKKEEVERLLKNPPADFDFEMAQASLAKALTRLNVASRSGRLPAGSRRKAPHTGRHQGEGPGE